MQTDRLISMQKCGIQVTKCRRKTDCLTKRGTKVLLFCQVRKKTGNKGNRLLRKGNFLTCLGQKSGTKVRKSAKKWVFSGGQSFRPSCARAEQTAPKVAQVAQVAQTCGTMQSKNNRISTQKKPQLAQLAQPCGILLTLRRRYREGKEAVSKMLNKMEQRAT